RIGRVVPAVGIWSPCRIRGCERRRAPAPRSGDALDCRRQRSAASPSQMGCFETQWLAAPENFAALADLFKREPDPRQAGDERLERPLRLHLLSPAVRV